MRRIIILGLCLLFLAGPALADHHLGPLDYIVSWFQGIKWPAFPARPFAIGCGGFSSDGFAPKNLIDPETGDVRSGVASTINLNCGAEAAELKFGVDLLNGDLGGSNLLASQGGLFRVRSVNQRAVYPVLNEELTVYRSISLNTLDGGYTEAERERGFNIPQQNFNANHPLGVIQCGDGGPRGSNSNYYHGIEGVKGKLKSPDKVFTTQMEIVLDDGTKIQGEVSSGQGRAFFKRNNKTIATFTWTGNLDTGKAAPDQSTVVAVFALTPTAEGAYDSRTRGAWRLAEESDWQQYISTGVLSKCILSVNVNTDELTRGAAALGGGKFTADGRAFEVDLGPGEIIVPQGVLWVDAEVLGLQQVQGKPQIISVAPPAGLAAGESRDLIVTVKNAGSFDGSFALAVKCGGTSMGVEQKFDVLKGATEPVPYALSFATEGSRSCEARVCDVTSPLGCVSQAFSVSVSPLKICDPGDTIVEGLVVFQCNSMGSQLRRILQCGGIQSINTGPTIDPVSGAQTGTGTFVTVSSIPEYAGGVWRCSGSRELNGGPCQAYRSAVLQQINAGSCQLICDIGGLPLSVDVTVGTSVVNLESGTLREAGCTPAVDVPVSLPVVDLVTPKKAAAPKTPPAGGAPSKAPAPPGFEGLYAIVGLLAVGYIVSWRGRTRDKGG